MPKTAKKIAQRAAMTTMEPNTTPMMIPGIAGMGPDDEEVDADEAVVSPDDVEVVLLPDGADELEQGVYWK